ncbi:hypothetical protein O3G_MSEX009645 [Manduca sexta]|uniref:Centrosomal protein of 97 kDa n=1 Tax=Manduca sexta TaxID=7130 RepID=A0A921ZE52_MANSE|nr:hypothetical protein O3G_MSEX009645 [Manduca sexta]
MDEAKNETVDLSRRGLKKIEKAPADESKTIINLILDQNELQRLDNIDTYSRVENLSICNNFLLRMHGVSRLTNIRVLALNNNGILQIEGLKDLIYLKVLKLAGNNIKSIEHLNHNMHLEHLDLSNNQISFIADISYLKSLKHLNLERNRIMDLRQCDRYLPPNLDHLGLGHNNIQDLNEICHLVHLSKLESFTIQGNPCVAMAGKDKLGFDYRPFVLNWIMSVKSIDGFVVSAIESLKAEWLYSQGKGRHFHSGQHQELCEYLASTCPLTADALETEDQRKLRLILSKVRIDIACFKQFTLVFFLRSRNEEKKLNGMKDGPDDIEQDKLEIIKLASNQRRQKKMSVESMAAVTIQKMWRGYRSRNLNKDTLRILQAIQAARARQHIQRLTCDMEATKAALESERKIQQLQMQAINALWKKVSTLQAAESKHKLSDTEENGDVLRQLTETCFSLQAQVVELQGSMQEVLRAVSRARAEPRATQTDITAVLTPQEERCGWLRRPQSLALSNNTAPDSHPADPPASPRPALEKTTEAVDLGIERTESVIEEKEHSQNESRERTVLID